MALILTKAGAEAYAEAEATGIKLQGTHMAVGDGNGVAVSPTNAWESLTNETWRGDLQSITANEAGQAVFVAHVPITVGGWYIREVGIFAGETLIAVAAYPEAWKPAPEAADKVELVITAPLAFSDTENISLTVDTTKVLASQVHVAEAIDTHDTDPGAHADIRQALIEKVHNSLSFRDAADAHPMSAVTGLADALSILDQDLAQIEIDYLDSSDIGVSVLAPDGDGSAVTGVDANLLRGLTPNAIMQSPFIGNRTATGTWTLTVTVARPVFLVAHAPLDQGTDAYVEFKVISGSISSSISSLNRVSGLGLAATGAGYSNCAVIIPSDTTLEIQITKRLGGAVVTAFQNNA
ncbi:phage tail protein [Pseudodesulfovibrio indicus]|uniref:Tail-collar fiber protein n=1 Tax=Pseudodesulfovibrio indicus TaxID=1716143 RepID=A0A126QLR4_9BACT|nr:phage tail protein [Pseudodesulfovibrio indicus]AMK10841.1 hypothetical protein AWY79_06845 [Pseudodesulfovibrio indicus]TDT91835.1 tail-collar fiber protein [Pseudodesulfovibrio indicus]